MDGAVADHMFRRLRGGSSATPAHNIEASKSPPSASVVIPLFNHAAYIGEAIDSVIAEGHCVREIIIVDDGSSDDSFEIACERAGSDDRLIVWSQPNGGAHSAINAGLGRATGEYVAILNSDDAFQTERLRTLCRMLDRDPKIWVATSAIEFIDSDGNAVRNEWYEAAFAFDKTSQDFGTTLINGNVLVSTSNFVIRRKILDRIGIFAPLRYAHDLDFAIRVLLGGGTIGRIEAPLLRYRMHDANTINEDHRRVRMEWAMVAGFYLTGIAGRRSDEPQRWERLRVFLSVLEEHRILAAASLCASYLLQHPPGTVSQSGMTGDAAFLDVLSACV